MKCEDGCGLDKPEISGYEVAKHTPTPWFIEDSDPQFVNFEKGTVAEAHGANKENRFANAAFIALAVNSHEELLAVAKRLLKVADTWQGKYTDGLTDLIDSAHKAIAKAEARS